MAIRASAHQPRQRCNFAPLCQATPRFPWLSSHPDRGLFRFPPDFPRCSQPTGTVTPQVCPESRQERLCAVSACATRKQHLCRAGTSVIRAISAGADSATHAVGYSDLREPPRQAAVFSVLDAHGHATVAILSLAQALPFPP